MNFLYVMISIYWNILFEISIISLQMMFSSSWVNLCRLCFWIILCSLGFIFSVGNSGRSRDYHASWTVDFLQFFDQYSIHRSRYCIFFSSWSILRFACLLAYLRQSRFSRLSSRARLSFIRFISRRFAAELCGLLRN